jgi:hypothetical protein
VAESYGQPLFDDMVTRYVLPEVERRRADATFDDDLVFRFQVLLPEGGEPEVRLNHEVAGTVMVTATRTIAAGEEVTVDDISGVSEYTPGPEDAGVPHVTGFLHRDGWSLVFEFNRGGHSDRFEFLRLGGDYLETAREALDGGRLQAFADNAYSACELLAKAELLSSRPTVELVLNSHSHAGVSRPYNAWAKLRNSDPRFAKLLGRLAEMRPAARYLQRELPLDPAGATDLLHLLEEMHAHVQAAVADGSGRGEPNVFYVYAARELRAGEIVRRGDFTLTPPR